MPKFKVTNISQTHKDGARNFFLTESGKLIKPGEHCVCNRLDNGTKAQADAKLLRIEEGDFALPSIFDEKKPDPKPEVPAVSPKTMAAEAAAKAEADAKAEAEAKAKAEADAVSAAKAEAADKADADKPESEMTKAEKKAAAKKAKAEAGNRGQG